MLENKQESDLLTKMLKKLTLEYRPANERNKKIFDGHEKLDDLGISLPEPINNLTIGVDWVRISLDAINSRVNLDGFISENDTVSKIAKENSLTLKAKAAHQAALIYGVCYLMAGPGSPAIGQPEVIISVESPMWSIGEFNTLTGECEAFLKIHKNSEFIYDLSFILPEKTYLLRVEIPANPFAQAVQKSLWDCLGKLQKESFFEAVDLEIQVLKKEEHSLGFVPVTQLVNRPDESLTVGKTEITRPMKQTVQDAIRTHASIVSVRESFSIPRAYLFAYLQETYGDKRNGDSSAVTRVLETLDPSVLRTIEPTTVDDKVVMPQLQQLTPGSFTESLALLEHYAKQIASMTGIPVTLLGVTSVASPPSAESLDAQMEAVNRKAEDKTVTFTPAWVSIMKHSMALLGEKNVEITPRWRQPKRLSIGASADAVTKLIAAGVFAANDEVVYKLLGLDEGEIESLQERSESFITQEALLPLTPEERVAQAKEAETLVGKYLGINGAEGAE